jgi:hypothetical protein
VLDDRESMVEALHQRVLEILGEKQPDGDASVEAPRLQLQWQAASNA